MGLHQSGTHPSLRLDMEAVQQACKLILIPKSVRRLFKSKLKVEVTLFSQWIRKTRFNAICLIWRISKLFKLRLLNVCLREIFRCFLATKDLVGKSPVQICFDRNTFDGNVNLIRPKSFPYDKMTKNTPQDNDIIMLSSKPF